MMGALTSQHGSLHAKRAERMSQRGSLNAKRAAQMSRHRSLHAKTGAWPTKQGFAHDRRGCASVAGRLFQSKPDGVWNPRWFKRGAEAPRLLRMLVRCLDPAVRERAENEQRQQGDTPLRARRKLESDDVEFLSARLREWPARAVGTVSRCAAWVRSGMLALSRALTHSGALRKLPPARGSCIGERSPRSLCAGANQETSNP